MVKRVTWAIALLMAGIAAAAPAGAEEAEERAAFEFDAVDASLEGVVARAQAEKKPIFLEFFLEG